MILLATMNKHKVEEISKIVPNIPFKNIRDFSDKWDVIENGETFEDNAVKKAREAAEHFGFYSVADDSGLEIKALDNFPGVESARFMEESNYLSKMDKILEMMKDFESEEDRYAQFRTVACFFDPLENNTIIVEGTVRGYISKQIQGKDGFGYDPIFIPEGFEETFGELPESVKNSFSHRARAFKELKGKLEKSGYIK
jgi:XTP/dITP diphosphohydrolase